MNLIGNKVFKRAGFAVLGLTLFFASCQKEEGRGGTSTIQGTVFVQDFNGAGQLNAEYLGVEERVYIVYGENEIYDDEVRTGRNGGYKFEFLHKGTYTIFAYSDCDTCSSGTMAVERTVEITDRKQEITLPAINVRR